MSFIFFEVLNFNKLLMNWDIRSVIIMYLMFFGV